MYTRTQTQTRVTESEPIGGPSRPRQRSPYTITSRHPNAFPLAFQTLSSLSSLLLSKPFRLLLPHALFPGTFSSPTVLKG